MPQEHYVSRCFSCETFQVHIVKKSNKWECKICKAKQSVKRNYGKGSGKDCRNQVMKLNELRVLKGNGSKLTEDDETLEEEVVVGESKDTELGREKSVSSKWTEYLDESIANDESENEDGTDFPSETVQTKKRVKNSSKNNENCKRICRNFKKSSEPLSGVCSESNPFLAVDDETLGSSDKQNMCETPSQKQTNEKHLRETNSTLKHSKYDKYMYDNDATQQPSINSNIFNSHLDDLDNILDF